MFFYNKLIKEREIARKTKTLKLFKSLNVTNFKHKRTLNNNIKCFIAAVK